MINNVQESSGAMRFSHCEHGEKSLTKEIGDTILMANSNRKYAAFINNSSAGITLVLGSKNRAFLNKGIILKAGGGSYEINSNNLYIGEVSVISNATCKLSFLECD